MPLFWRKKAPLLGIDISSTSIKLLELGRSGNRYCVESYSVEPLPPNCVVERNITDVQLVGETISRTVKKSGTRLRTAASRSDNIEVRVAALELGGLKAKIVDIEAFALEQLFANNF